jgi:hypothetical protein
MSRTGRKHPSDKPGCRAECWLPEKELNSLNNAIVTNMVYFLKMFNRSQLAFSAASMLTQVGLLETFFK